MSWPRLILDVINNHHTKYYQGEDDPGDWEEPTLVYFLAIGAGEQFEFAISDRRPANDDLLETTCGWLRDALTSEGAGAKTAAGYGRFKPVGEAQAPMLESIPEKLTSATYELRLVTPAFLAGANQQKDDCDLRPATLRGLLRWWWRTMHAAHLDRKTLAQLETAVWGDAQSGSPVRIAVDFLKGGGAQRYDKTDQQLQNLPRPQRRQRITQGLFYASYGMADDPEKENRWFRPAGSCWRITLTARRGDFHKDQNIRDPLQPNLLMEQVNASLWLLARFGGAGSRARKGFGSFDGLEMEGINSIDDCIAAAQGFRTACDLPSLTRQSVKTPALEKALIMEGSSRSGQTLGMRLTKSARLLFAKQKLADKKDRIALGLPRFDDRLDKELSDELERQASPALWSLSTSDTGRLLIRLIAFPAARLPNVETSKQTLQKLCGSAHQQLQQQAQRTNNQRGRGQARTRRPDRRGSHSPSPSRSRPQQTGPKATDRVSAELLEEKTKKGGWKAKHIDSGLQGPIQDSQKVPEDAQPGQRVELTVASVSAKEMAFKRASPPPPKRQSRRRR